MIENRTNFRRQSDKENHLFLVELQSSLKRLEDKTNLHYDSFKEFKNDSKKKIDEINKIINGNGKFGLKTRLTIIEVTIAILILGKTGLTAFKLFG